jgi:hypothetical protein
MSIFLDNSGASGTGFFNLLTVSGEDGGLGLTDVPGDTTVSQVTYVETPGQPATADRLNQLVNNNFPGPVSSTQNIVVTPLNGGNDPHGSGDITGNGVAYIDSTGPSLVIRIVYDVSQCCGSGIFLFDTGGNRISDPNPVIVYHELSHAFRAVTRTNLPDDEVPAETDENVLRAQLGLCLRDVTNHDGGCGGGDDCGGSAGNADGEPPSGGCADPGGGGCFIVSATTGSSTSVEVTRLRHLRDRVALASSLGAQLIEEIYQEYYQFSPGIAANLEQDVVARTAVLLVVVRPLLAWYTLAGALALDRADDNAARQAAQDVISACPRYLGGSSIATLLERIRSGEPLPADAPQLLVDLAPRLQEAAALQFASWAILDPLIRVWKPARSHYDVIDDVSQWLATAPLEALTPPSDSESMELEFRGLAGLFDFQPEARRQLGVRLAAAWPEATTTLERYGFFESGGAI